MNVSVIVIILSLAMIGLISIPVFAQEFDDLDYEIRGGTILNFEIDSKTATLIISLDARARGELTITLPRYLIDAKSGSDDVDFDIFVSGLKLNSIDETITPFERTVTIPFKRSNSELIITGTHVFSQLPVTQTIPQQSTDEIIISEHLKDTHDGNAELLIFSDTTWSGALQSSSFDYTDVDGQNNDSVIFGCESSLGRQGVFGAKIKKLTQDGFLKIVVIQNQRIVSQVATTEEFGEVLINGNCESESSSAPGGGGCLIATATYGSEMAPQVQQLRELRDNTLLHTESGKLFMNSFNEFYYSFSPVIADLEREHPVFKETVKLFITPMVSSLSILNHVEMDSEESVLGYGISLIILNLAMYVGIPASVIIGIKKKF
jgi:hypothetical protein